MSEATGLDVGIIGTLGGVIVLLVTVLVYVVRTRTDTAATNKAVNHVPPGTPTLVDRIERIERAVERIEASDSQFAAKGWGALPPDLATAPALTESFREVQHKLDKVLAELREHVDWEMSVKWKEAHREP